MSISEKRRWRFLRSTPKFRVAVCAGEDHEGLAGIHRAYREAREAETFLPLLEWDYIRYRCIGAEIAHHRF